MLEQLFKLIQQESEQEIINNPAIPNEHNNHAVGLVTDSIFSGLQSAVASGGIGNLLSLFSGKSNVGSGNPLVSGIVNMLVKNLMGKFGLNNGVASTIAGSLVPKVLSKLVSRTTDPNDSGFNLNGILASLTGLNSNQGGPVQVNTNNGAQGGIDFDQILSQLTGNARVTPQNTDQVADNGFGLDDIIRMVRGGGASQASQQQAEGGLDIAGMLNALTGSAQQQQQQQQGSGGMLDMLQGLIGGSR